MMNNRYVNFLLVICGFIAHLLFARSPEWNIVGIMGILVSSAAAANLSYLVWPNLHNALDWIVPAITLIVLGLVVFLLRSSSFFGLEGAALYVAEALSLLITLTPLARLYGWIVLYRKSL